MLKRCLAKLKGFSQIAFSDKNLLTTNVLISISLSGVGDFIEQVHIGSYIYMLF